MASSEAAETFERAVPSRRVLASSAESLADRIAPWVALVACVWFALAAAWGLFGPIPAGHYGTMGGEGIIGENMVRWHIFGPVWEYETTPPTLTQYYCHHPWGGFWIMGFLFAIFGHHNFVLPLPAVLMSAATPPLLYGIAKQAWGKVPGAAAAVGFVFLPIVLGFANFHNVEVTVIFGCCLFFWGHARMLATWKLRHMLASLAGVALAASADWPAYVVLATLLAMTLVRGFLLPRQWASAFSFRRYATWWVLSVTLSVGFLALWIYLFARSDKLLDWLSSATSRGLGAPTTLEQALAGRKHWIELSFTPPVIFLGKLAVPIAFLRLFLRRRDEEAYSLSILAGATASYVFFKQAADVHIFWSHYFGGYFALAFAQLVATLSDGARWFTRRLPARWPALAAQMGPLAFTAAFGLTIAPDGFRALRYARETGGRFNEGPHALSSEINIVRVLYLLKDRLPRWAGPDLVSPHLQWSWAYKWASQGQGRAIQALPTEHAQAHDPHPIFMARASGLSVDQQRALVSTFHVEIYDNDIWVVDRQLPAAALDAFTLDEHEPSLWEWYFISGVEPVRKYVPDPFSTWEWRTHLGQPATLPHSSPNSLEQVRIAHNIAVVEHDAQKAQEWKARLERGLVRDAATSFTQGISLLGFHRIGGTEPRIVLLFEATQTPTSDATFGVHAIAEKSKTWSFIPPDPTEREVAMPAALSTLLYRPGFIYSHTVVLRQRISTERFSGSFQSKDGSAPPARVDGQPSTPLLALR
jgi:hypothetical protein